MENKIPKISFIQLAAVIVVCRIFSLMTHIPLINDGYSLAEQILAISISAAAAAVLIIPSVAYYRKSQKGIIDGICKSPKTLGIIAAAFYSVYLFFACTKDISEFTAFIGCRFNFGAGNIIISMMLIIVCLYCAYCGAEGICRSAGTVIVLFLIMAAFMLYGSGSKASAENIRCDLTYKNTISAALEDLAGGTELILLCLMGKFTRDKYRCGAYFSLAGRLVLGIGITAAAVLILGDYAYMCSYPFLDIGSAAGIRFLQRTDAVYMIVWTLSAVLSLSLKIFIGANILRIFLPKKFPAAAAFSAAAYIMSLFSVTGGNVFMLAMEIICLAVIPTVLLIADR